MEITHLADMINDPRESDIRLTLNSGTELIVDQEARAILWEGVVLYVVWPTDGDILRVRRSVTVAPSNVACAEFIAPGSIEAA